MTTICPTITATDAHQYRQQAELLEPFAHRWHIDIADGQLAPRALISPDQLWWPANVQVDLHVIYKNPLEHLALFIALHPQLVIVHAEAKGDFVALADSLHGAGIEVGIALLPTTTPDSIKPALEIIDHVLIFSGNLGYQGGSKANVQLLQKARRLRDLKPTLEIGWDGGVNDSNARVLAHGGVDVLNVGGYIHTAQNPGAAYAKLEAAVKA